MIKNHPDMSALWHDSVERMWHGTIENKGIDFIASIDTIAYDNLLAADSMAFEFDLGRDLWLTKQRWTMLLRQYLDLSSTVQFIQRAVEIATGEGKRGVVTSMFNKATTAGKKKHRWGNCMIGYTYRGLRNEQPVFAMHSRVSYIAYIGGLDLALAHVLAREIATRAQVPVEDFKFRWYIDALQFHGFKSLPFLYKQDYIEDLENHALRAKYPTIKLVGKWYDQIVDFTERGIVDNKYGPLKRVMRRYREYIAEDYQPSLTLPDLTLEPLRRLG